MKLILLRHENRTSDYTFFSPLTELGINNSINLEFPIDVDYIFSSPYIRTIQTIYPYCMKNNKLINIEYGLKEFLFNPEAVYYNSLNYLYPQWEKYIYLNNIINNNYKSIIENNIIHIPEIEENLDNRLVNFFNTLLSTSNLLDKTILIISHQGVINKIKNFYITPTKFDEKFDMGHFEIYKI